MLPCFFYLAFTYSTNSEQLNQNISVFAKARVSPHMLRFVVGLRFTLLLARADDVTDRQTESSNI